MTKDIFGKSPDEEKVSNFEKLKNYKNGQFQNVTFTPDLTEGYSMTGVMYDFLITDHPRQRPINPIPSVKTNLLDIISKYE